MIPFEYHTLLLYSVYFLYFLFSLPRLEHSTRWIWRFIITSVIILIISINYFDQFDFRFQLKGWKL